jgi:E3 ubiquitin-protein ligase SHPRH
VYDGIREVRKQDIEALYESVKECHKDAPSNKLPFIQHSSLVPILRPYQSEAVKWMLCKETSSDSPSGECFVKNLTGRILK